MEHGTEMAAGKWSAPECPFQIEYSTRVLDDIRLAVVDGFFSLPRGGAEIGGILLGKWDGDRISITDYEALDCEHAMGPSFTLSPRDQTRLAEMTALAKRNPGNRQPVGWYHSHTRSEIFLSDTDQDIHKRYFPEPWQVALVLKPHTFEPTRGGFFFREADGSMRGTASYQEFVLEPLPLRPAPAGAGNGSPGAHRPLHDDSAVHAEPAKGRVPITREIPVDPPLEDAPDVEAPAAEIVELDAPAFTQVKQERSWRAATVVVCLAVGLAAGGLGYQTREFWLPPVMAKARAVLLPKEPEGNLSLSVQDDDGQLQIQWDRNAPAVRNALEAILEIIDGNTVPKTVRLDGSHLASGAFRYIRESERVDVVLIASEPSGQQVREQTSFLGKLPVQKQAAEDDEVRKERDAEAERADKLQKDVNFQAAKMRKMERDLKEMRDLVEQKRRLDNQAPDSAKKN